MNLKLISNIFRVSVCFETLLENTNLVSVHQKNLQLLMIEIYKSNGLNPSFMKDMFAERESPYNLRTSKGIILPHSKMSSFCAENIRFIGQKIWQKLPNDVKESRTLSIFKAKIEEIQVEFSSILCKKYIYNVGFIQIIFCKLRVFNIFYLISSLKFDSWHKLATKQADKT